METEFEKENNELQLIAFEMKQHLDELQLDYSNMLDQFNVIRKVYKKECLKSPKLI